MATNDAAAETQPLIPPSPTSSSPASSTILKKRQRKPTPLPYAQIGIVLLVQICEPIASQSIYPYINQLVSELDITGGDERKVGYYAGLIESLFFATEALTVFQWSHLSDQIGRKPVLLVGLAGSTISMLCFGMSRTFETLVISRCVTGLLNGNIGVMKSVMGDLTDSSNRAEGLALMPVVWATGATIGPLMGGYLARPHEHFYPLFQSRVWKEFPYLLPCIAASAFVALAFLVTVFFFKESLPAKRRPHPTRYPSYNTFLTSAESATPSSAAPLACTTTNSSPSPHSSQLPFRALLTYPVLLSISNYVVLAFLNIAFSSLFPLFLSSSRSIGGLGMQPSTIGVIIGVYGAFTGAFQFFFFAKCIRWLGERKVVVAGMMAFLPLFASFPVMSWLCSEGGGVVLWVVIGTVIVLETMMDMAYGAVFLYIIASAPSKSALGATNGLSQTSVSVARALGPAIATSLFSVSVQENLLGGHAVYLLFVAVSVCGVLLAVRLPEGVWEEEEEEGEYYEEVCGA